MPKGDYSFVKDKAVQRMLDNFDLSSDAEAENRKRGLKAIQFYRGGKSQWDDNIYNIRNGIQPTESYNQIPKFIRQITNLIRQNKAQTKVVANMDGEEKVAGVIEDLMRAIQAQSQADVAYDMAGFNSTVNGWGYWRWLKEYENDTSFDQILKIGQIPNPFKIYDDPFCTRQDKLDRKFLIEVEDVKKSDFNREEGKSYDSLDLQSIGDAAPDWATETTVRRAEYWEVKDVESDLWKNKITGEVTSEKPSDPNNYDYRVVITPKVIWRKCTAMEVLEEQEWDGKYIPYIFVAGETIYEDGKIYYSGAVEPMIPPQKLFNYAANAIVQAVSSQPLAPYIAAVGQITEPLAQFWDNANTKNTAWLPYNPITVNGQVAPPPQRQQQSADITSLVEVMKIAQEGFNEASGQYQANIGAVSNEKSGVAIQRRNMQSETSTFHFPDNLARALTASGIVALDLIQKTYDGSRVVRLLKEDKTDYTQEINKVTTTDAGEEDIFDLTLGTYDVMVDVGPGYTTKRQEGAAAMVQLAGSTNLMEVAPDIVYREQDWPGAQEIAERYKKLLPPQLQDQPNLKDVPPEVQAQMQQMGNALKQMQGQLQATTQALAAAEQQLKSKQLETQASIADSNNKLQSDTLKAQTEAMKAENDKLQLLVDNQKTLLQIQQLDFDTAKLKFEALQSLTQDNESQQEQEPSEEPSETHMQVNNSLKEAELQQQAQGIVMLAQMLDGIKNALDAQSVAVVNLTQTVSTPKTAVKGANGNWVVAPVG